MIILRIKLKNKEESMLGTVEPYALDEAALDEATLGANGSEEADAPLPKAPAKSDNDPNAKLNTNPNIVKTTA